MSIERAIEALRAGRAVILLDYDDREAEGDLAFAARSSSTELVSDCLSLARGLLCLSLWPEDARRLGVERLPTNGRDPFGTPFGYPIDLDDGSSGVSAPSRAATLRAACDREKTAEHFVWPGHVHTLIAHPEGLQGRIGHTEAILDLLELAGVPGPGVLCEILNDRGEIANGEELEALGEERDLPRVHIDEIVARVGATSRPQSAAR